MNTYQMQGRLLNIRLTVMIFALIYQWGVGQESVVGQETAQPNVIIIYADDLGSIDANCYGSQDLETPNIDRLAKTGVRFTQMYAPSAICSSSRAGLLTGRIPARAGVPGNISSQKGEAGMPTEEVTIAEMLKARGYATGHVGKWHLGYTAETVSTLMSSKKRLANIKHRFWQEINGGK